MVIDASVVLRGFFPDEEGHAVAQAIIRAYVREEVDLHAPTLLPYEVTNAILQAVRRGRINLFERKRNPYRLSGPGYPDGGSLPATGFGTGSHV